MVRAAEELARVAAPSPHIIEPRCGKRVVQDIHLAVLARTMRIHAACGSTVATSTQGAEAGDYYTTENRPPGRCSWCAGKDGKVNVLYNRCRTGAR